MSVENKEDIEVTDNAEVTNTVIQDVFYSAPDARNNFNK